MITKKIKITERRSGVKNKNIFVLIVIALSFVLSAVHSFGAVDSDESDQPSTQQIISTETVAANVVAPKAVATKAVVTNIVTSKTTATKAAVTKAVATKAVMTNAVTPKAAVTKVAATNTVAPKAAEPKTVVTKTAATKTMVTNAVMLKATAAKAAVSKVAVAKTVAPKASAVKAAAPKIKSKSTEMTKEEVMAELKEDFADNKEVLGMIPELKTAIDRGGKAAYTYGGAALESLSKEDMAKLLSKVRQALVRIRTDRIQKQLDTIKQAERLQGAAGARQPLRVPTATPSVPKPPPLPPSAPPRR